MQSAAAENWPNKDSYSNYVPFKAASFTAHGKIMAAIIVIKGLFTTIYVHSSKSVLL